MEKKLYIETFGCQMNVNDSEKIVSLLKGLEYRSTKDPEEADLIILNTCSIRAKAEHKVYSMLGRFRELKETRPQLLIGVGGCVAQQEGKRLLSRTPFVNLVFGTHNLHQLPDIVRAAERGERLVATDFIDNETRMDLFPSVDGDGAVTRFVTVMQGCDNFCSYCIVPYVRGREISRRSGEILDEIAALAAAGVREVTLIGQNVNSYGLGSSGEISFADLLRATAAVEGIERVRFTTSHPKDMSPDLIRCFAEVPKLCGHIHLPAQSGSDRVLERMNRGYSRDEYLAQIRALREARPDILITGDMIVGFPGETDEDFRQTIELMEEVRYTDLFSFIYSSRPETKAAAFKDDVTRAEKQKRLEQLQVLQQSHTLESHRKHLDQVLQVLVEAPGKREGQMFGRTSGNRIVNFAAKQSLVGKIVNVRITRAHNNSLLGELV